MSPSTNSTWPQKNVVQIGLVCRLVPVWSQLNSIVGLKMKCWEQVERKSMEQWTTTSRDKVGFTVHQFTHWFFNIFLFLSYIYLLGHPSYWALGLIDYHLLDKTNQHLCPVTTENPISDVVHSGTEVEIRTPETCDLGNVLQVSVWLICLVSFDVGDAIGIVIRLKWWIQLQLLNSNKAFKLLMNSNNRIIEIK